MRVMLLIFAMCGVLLFGSGCSERREGGQQRGLFAGYVMDKSEKEVEAKFGKPASIDNSSPTTQKWTYKRITFDPDNMNQVDNETILIFQKDASGTFKVTQVIVG